MKKWTWTYPRAAIFAILWKKWKLIKENIIVTMRLQTKHIYTHTNPTLFTNDGATINQQDARFIKQRKCNITAARSVFRKDSWESANPDEQCDTRSILRQVSTTTRLRRRELRKAREQRKWNNPPRNWPRNRMNGRANITCCSVAAQRR